jgi:hypothetical protein
MSTIMATVRDGVIVPREPLDWPNGAKVGVTLLSDDNEPELRGMTEEEQGETPEAIAKWLAEWNAIPTPIMSDEEWSAWEQRRREDKEWELSGQAEREAKLVRGLE